MTTTSFFADIAEPHFDTGCKRPLMGFVGRLPVDLARTPDERREYLISTYGYLLEQCMSVVDEGGDRAEQLTWRMRADICKQQMESLIASRRQGV